MTACDGDNQWVNEACAPKCNPSSGIWINISFWSDFFERNNRENPSIRIARRLFLTHAHVNYNANPPRPCVMDANKESCTIIIMYTALPFILVILSLCSSVHGKRSSLRGKEYKHEHEVRVGVAQVVRTSRQGDITWLVTTYWPEPTGFLITH
jgi:hypothetical protein